MGTHSFSVSAKDWFGTSQVKVLTFKLLLSSADCENTGTLTLSYTGNAAVSVAMGAAKSEYAWTMAPKSPSYCKHTYKMDAVPTTNGINTYLAADATNKKWTLAKIEGAKTLAAAYTVTVTGTTLWGTAISNKKLSKVITITDPCKASLFTVKNAADVTYPIGAADKVVLTWSSQVTQSGGTTTAFCITKRTSATFTYSSDSNLFSSAAGIVTFKKSTTVAAKKSITVTGQLTLDGSAVTGKTFTVKVTTSENCSPPTFTLPTASSTAANVFIGRSTTLTIPAWTLAS